MTCHKYLYVYQKAVTARISQLFALNLRPDTNLYVNYMETTQKPTITLDSIDRYNRLYGFETRHPLVTVVNIKDAQTLPGDLTLTYGLYAIFLKNGANCSLRYGRRQYDYQEGTVVTFAPGQTIEVVRGPNDVPQDVPALLFHPDLIYGTPLGQKIQTFGYFDFSQMEALHLSERERAIFLDCLATIDRELEHPVDAHTASVLSANIQLLLEYLDRFYDRQFATRHKVNSEIVARFERQLKEFYDRPHAGEGFPSVNDFASKANLSPKYFGELVKKETGLTPKTMIMQHLINVAKHRLAVSQDDISIIAYDLGFDYPAHFTRMFKRVTGVSPTVYRQTLSLN